MDNTGDANNTPLARLLALTARLSATNLEAIQPHLEVEDEDAGFLKVLKRLSDEHEESLALQEPLLAKKQAEFKAQAAHKKKGIHKKHVPKQGRHKTFHRSAEAKQASPDDDGPKDEKDSGKQKGEDLADTEQADSEEANLDRDPSFVKNVYDELIDLWSFFSHQEWTNVLDELQECGPMEIPEGLKFKPHRWQLIGALKMVFSGRHLFGGMILADPLGLGKTKTALLAMWLGLREVPGGGKILLLVPACLIPMWKQELDDMFEEGYEGLNYHDLKAEPLSAEEMLECEADVFIQSYEGLETKYRSRNERGKMDYDERKGKRVVKAPIHSFLWEMRNVPFLMVVCDEAQRISNMTTSTYKAVRSIPARMKFFLTATPLHNKWTSCAAYISMLRNLPFNTFAKFCRAFGEHEDNSQLCYHRMMLLKRLLQGVMVCRPANSIILPPLEQYMLYVPIEEKARDQANEFFESYRASAGASGRPIEEWSDPNTQETAAFGFAAKAQQAAMHPILVEDIEDSQYLMDVEIDWSPESRKEWQQRLAKCEDYSSARIEAILDQMESFWDAYPGEKMCVFSIYLRFLDVLAKAFEKRYGYRPARYDGTASTAERERSKKNYMKSPKNKKNALFMTIGAGAYGHNMTEITLVIFCEPTWNINLENHALARFWRQGQKNTVKMVMVIGEDILMDTEKLTVATKKYGNSMKVMKGLPHDDAVHYSNFIPKPPPKYETLDLSNRLPKYSKKVDGWLYSDDSDSDDEDDSDSDDAEHGKMDLDTTNVDDEMKDPVEEKKRNAIRALVEEISEDLDETKEVDYPDFDDDGSDGRFKSGSRASSESGASNRGEDEDEDEGNDEGSEPGEERDTMTKHGESRGKGNRGKANGDKPSKRQRMR